MTPCPPSPPENIADIRAAISARLAKVDAGESTPLCDNRAELNVLGLAVAVGGTHGVAGGDFYTASRRSVFEAAATCSLVDLDERLAAIAAATGVDSDWLGRLAHNRRGQVADSESVRLMRMAADRRLVMAALTTAAQAIEAGTPVDVELLTLSAQIAAGF